MSEKPFKIFVVEDDDWYNRLLVHNLSLNPDYEVVSFFNGHECLANLHQEPDLVTLDYRLPDLNGIEILRTIKKENSDIQVILISEQNDIEVVVELLKEGAYDYIVKSKDVKERLLNTVNNVRQQFSLEKELTLLRREIQHKYSFQNTIIGSSKPIKKVFGLIEKAIRTNITVSVTGETGTGKELVAKAIHYNSGRKDKPFIAVNVAAVPSELIESELFGHEKGAFTGAAYRRIGKFEEANEGTLFLDEIAEMEKPFQAKLLRALQEKEIIRVGSNTPVKTDCRIIVATNKNLLEEVRNGNFRQDLYYRLFGLTIDLPPLRDRGNDILLLARHFISEFCNENNLGKKDFNGGALNKLMNYTFPGNVRELKSVVELAATLANGDTITEENILLGSDDILPGIMTEEMSLREYEHRIVTSFLERYDNNVKTVAEKLDVGMSTIYRMIKEKEKENE
jgi:two-component system response regulator AtoC